MHVSLNVCVWVSVLFFFLLFCATLIWFHVFNSVFYTIFFKWWPFWVQLRDHFIEMVILVYASCFSRRIFVYCVCVAFHFISLSYFEGISFSLSLFRCWHCYYIFYVRDVQLLFLWLRGLNNRLQIALELKTQLSRLGNCHCILDQISFA